MGRGGVLGTGGRRSRQPRSDALRNRRRLLEAAGAAVRADPGAVTMPAIAARAEIAVATAYRYFSSVDEVLLAYTTGVLADLRDFSLGVEATGSALFEQVLGRWIELVREHGPAM